MSPTVPPRPKLAQVQQLTELAKATKDKTPIENLSVTVQGVTNTEQLHALVRLSASTGLGVSSIRSGTGQTFTYSLPVAEAPATPAKA